MGLNKNQRYQRKRYRTASSQGTCFVCFIACDVNPRTAKPYLRCPEHRARANASQQRRAGLVRARWEAPGLCRDCGVPAMVDRVSGRPLRRCFTHLAMNAQTQAARRARRYGGPVVGVSPAPYGRGDGGRRTHD